MITLKAGIRIDFLLFHFVFFLDSNDKSTLINFYEFPKTWIPNRFFLKRFFDLFIFCVTASSIINYDFFHIFLFILCFKEFRGFLENPRKKATNSESVNPCLDLKILENGTLVLALKFKDFRGQGNISLEVSNLSSTLKTLEVFCKAYP